MILISDEGVVYAVGESTRNHEATRRLTFVASKLWKSTATHHKLMRFGAPQRNSLLLPNWWCIMRCSSQRVIFEHAALATTILSRGIYAP